MVMVDLTDLIFLPEVAEGALVLLVRMGVVVLVEWVVLVVMDLLLQFLEHL